MMIFEILDIIELYDSVFFRGVVVGGQMVTISEVYLRYPKVYRRFSWSVKTGPNLTNEVSIYRCLNNVQVARYILTW